MQHTDKETTSVEVEELASTAKASLFLFTEAEKQAWIPKSCIVSRTFPNTDSKTHFANIFNWILKKHDII